MNKPPAYSHISTVSTKTIAKLPISGYLFVNSVVCYTYCPLGGSKDFVTGHSRTKYHLQRKRGSQLCKCCEDVSQSSEEKKRSTQTTNIQKGEANSVNHEWVLDESMIQEIVRDTMLESKALARAYDSRAEGFSNEEFFNKMIPLDGVPSLVLGVTSKGQYFGGYTSHGFAARDDYREARSEKGLFVFAIRDGKVMISESTDRVLYDFYDYAIRFGTAMLGIPMNPGKHVMKANVGTSSCRMSDGLSSVFGDTTLAALDRVEVLVAKEYHDAVAGQANGGGPDKGGIGGLFSRLFQN